MARKIIDTGTLGNPATGDSLRTAMTKINTNFEELYIGNAADGQLTTSVTNGDISIQPNGTGTVEIDAISVNSDNITSLTTNSSVTITGNGTAGVDIEGISVNGTTISSSDSSTININENLIVDGTGDFSGTLSVTGAATLTAGATIDGISITDNTISTGSSNANLELTASGTGAVKVNAILSLPDGSDSDNYVGVGDADDLKIFHNGSHSIIRETGTGNLFLQSDNNVIIGKDSGSETMIKGVADGAVELYHDDTKKFETTANGVSVVGSVTSTGATDLTLSTNAGTDSGTIVITDGTNGDITIETDGTGDILLKAGGQVGIGSVSSPDTQLHIKSASSIVTLQRTADANQPGIDFQNSGGNVRAELRMDGTSGTSNEVFVKTHDGSSLAERFRVGHTKTSVAGHLEVSGAQVDFTALPTSDPGVAGRLFRSGNDVKISTG